MGLGLWGIWKQHKASSQADGTGFATDETERPFTSFLQRFSPGSAVLHLIRCSVGSLPLLTHDIVIYI